MKFIKRVIGYVLFIPLIYFYSYFLGPTEGTRALKKAFKKK
tara:strand:+ start:14365 stop:14487 length:123 start_codon:yes stop_codon:yes gene_type:complete